MSYSGLTFCVHCIALTAWASVMICQKHAMDWWALANPPRVQYAKSSSSQRQPEKGLDSTANAAMSWPSCQSRPQNGEPIANRFFFFAQGRPRFCHVKHLLWTGGVTVGWARDL